MSCRLSVSKATSAWIWPLKLNEAFILHTLARDWVCVWACTSAYSVFPRRQCGGRDEGVGPSAWGQLEAGSRTQVYLCMT